jgi:hypothetical protein
MKYIGNGFSVNMIEDEATITINNITKEEFMEQLKEGYSVVGHPEIAEHFGVALNRESITLQPDDYLFIVTTNKRPNEGKTVENGDKYQFIPEDDGWIYKMVYVQSALGL